MTATAASLSSPSTCLLSTPIPLTCLFSCNPKPIARALNPKTKKPPRLSCVIAASKPGPWRDLFILNAWVVHDYCCLVVSVGVLQPALRRLSDEPVPCFTTRRWFLNIAMAGCFLDMAMCACVQMKAKMAEFRAHLVHGETLADVQAEAFAVVREDKDPNSVREAARRTLGMRHFDVQIIGGAVLHDGCIAEMKMG